MTTSNRQIFAKHKPLALFLFLFVFFTSLAEPIFAQQPAFPGAEGFGRYAQGGRGGDVYYVTHLHDSGPGSLRYGIETANGPRTILFTISGTIFLENRLAVDKPFITIAGQTAPGDGITIANHSFRVQADHVIIRFIRFRLGDAVSQKENRFMRSLRIFSGSNIIIDHCSVSWSPEVNLQAFRESDLVTIQWSMITESLYDAGHRKGGRAYGGVIQARRESQHHNLYAHHNARSPKISWRHHIQVDFRNNVIYNWGSLNNYDGALAHVNWVNNYYKAGPATPPDMLNSIFHIWDRIRYDPLEWPVPEVDKGFTPQFYIEGNYVEGYPEISTDNWAGGVRYGYGAGPELRVSEPHPFPQISYETDARNAYERVLARSGASLARDSIDNRIIDEVRQGTATFGGNYGELSGIIDSQDDVGGWPDLRSTDPPVDSDGDGMPDWWEIQHGLDPFDPADGNYDRKNDGYTNLEEYLNWLVNP